MSRLKSGRVEVTLPSGVRVRGFLPTLSALMRDRLLPNELYATAVKLADPKWIRQHASDPDAEFQGEANAVLNHLAASFVREEWDDDEGAWAPVHLTGADLDGPEQTLEPGDADALIALALRLRTPAEISAVAGVTEGVNPSTDDGEVPAAIPAWEPFRVEPGGAEAGEDGAGVQPAPELVAPSGRRRGGVRGG